MAGKEDVLVRAAPLVKQIADWRRFLRGEGAANGLLVEKTVAGRKSGPPVMCECKE